MGSFETKHKALPACQHRLKGFSSQVQHYGDWIAGYPWQIWACLTFRKATNQEEAEKKLRTLFSRLQKELHLQLAWVAVAEHKISGNGKPGVGWHWHLVVAGPEQDRDVVAFLMKLSWEVHQGNGYVVPYDPKQSGAYYLMKTADAPDFQYLISNLDHLAYHGSTDLLQEFRHRDYVPEHVRHLPQARTLALRDLAEIPIPARSSTA